MSVFSKKIKKRGLYFITTGDKVGGFIVWVSEYDISGAHAFLFMPNPMESIFLSYADVTDGLKTGKLDFVKILPIEVYDVCGANWKYYADKVGLKYEH